MSFTEANTVEAFIRDRLCGGVASLSDVPSGLARRNGQILGLGWHLIAAQHLPRRADEVLVEGDLRAALARLNPEIADRPEAADDVLYRLRAIILAVRSD